MEMYADYSREIKSINYFASTPFNRCFIANIEKCTYFSYIVTYSSIPHLIFLFTCNFGLLFYFCCCYSPLLFVHTFGGDHVTNSSSIPLSFFLVLFKCERTNPCIPYSVPMYFIVQKKKKNK